MQLSSYQAIFKQTFQAWSDDKAARLGAALAFYSILSLGPLLLLMLTGASWFWGHDAAQGRIAGQMTAIVGKGGADAIETLLNSSSKSTQGSILASLFGFVTLLFSASGAFGELQDAMNIIWKVEVAQQRPLSAILRGRLLSFLMVMGSALIMIVSFFLSTVLSALSGYLKIMTSGVSMIGHAFDFITSLCLISLIFAATFKFVPDRPIAWKDILLPSFLTAIFFVLGKMAIAFYIGHAGIGSSFGAAGSVIILLVWIYYSSQIIFFGAEFAFAYSQILHKSADQPAFMKT